MLRDTSQERPDGRGNLSPARSQTGGCFGTVEPPWMPKFKEDIRLIIRSELAVHEHSVGVQGRPSGAITAPGHITSGTAPGGANPCQIFHAPGVVTQEEARSPARSPLAEVTDVTVEDYDSDQGGPDTPSATPLRSSAISSSPLMKPSRFASASKTKVNVVDSSVVSSHVHAPQLKQGLHHGQTNVGMKQSFEGYWRQTFHTRSLPVLEPDGRFNSVWKPFVFLITVYTVIALPCDVALSWAEPGHAYKVVGFVVDFLFLMDMAFHFNIGVLVERNHICRDRKKIAYHYATTWLAFDILSNFPADWFLGSDAKHRKLIKFLKMPKIFRFIRLFRLLKSSLHYIGTAVVVAGILLFAHYAACIWIFIFVTPFCEESSDIDRCPNVAGTYAEAVAAAISAMTGTDSWTRFIYGAQTGSRVAHFRGAVPLDGWEEMLNVGISVGGLVLLACLFGTVSHAMSKMNIRGQIRSAKLTQRKNDMKEADIPLGLQKRVEATYENVWMCGDWHDGFLTDDTLSLDLRRNLAYHVYGSAIHSVPMFSRMAVVAVKCIAQKIKSRCYTPGDLIILQGEQSKEMFLVNSGVAQPVDNQSNTILEHVKFAKGDFFGEISFCIPGARRSCSVVCTEFCRLLILELSMFEQLAELGFESLLDNIREDCSTRMEEMLKYHHHGGAHRRALSEMRRLSSITKPTDVAS